MQNTHRSQQISYRNREAHCKRQRMRRRVRSIRNFLTGIAAVLLIAVCTFSVGSFSEAHEDRDPGMRGEPTRYYKSIQIEEGDTLWSIAEQYTDGGLDSVCRYMDELAELNRLSYPERDTLRAGDYLLVAYCDTEP